MSLKLNFFNLFPASINRRTKKTKYLSILVILLASLSLLAGCINQEKPDEISSGIEKNLIVACTIPPQEEFIKAVGGNSVEVLVMVPPGANPHTFEPTPSQISKLETADLYITLGSGIEFENRWMARIRGMFPDLPLVNSSERILLRHEDEHHHEGESSIDGEEEEATDPHIWLSIKNSAEMVNTTCTALTELRPLQKEKFRKNRDQYLLRLSYLDTEIQKILTDIPSRTILVYHPSFGYFCQDYNLTQISIEENGREPAAQSLANLIDKAKAEKITLIFTEPEVSTRGAETLAAEINGKIILISTLSGEYLKNMKHIADSIAGR